MRQERLSRVRKWGDPRRGGERGSPSGPAPGGQSRVRYPRKPSCNRGKLPAARAEAQRVLLLSPMLPDRRHIRREHRGNWQALVLRGPGSRAQHRITGERPAMAAFWLLQALPAPAAGRVAGMQRAQSIEITNPSRRGLSKAAAGQYKGITGRWARTRKPGTHARPAAGGVPWQANSGRRSAGAARA